MQAVDWSTVWAGSGPTGCGLTEGIWEGPTCSLAAWPCNVVWCCGLMAASPCSAGLLHLLVLIFGLVTTWVFVRRYINFNMKTILLGEWSSLLGQGLWTRARGQGSIPSLGDPGGGQPWQGEDCPWDPRHSGWEKRNPQAVRKAGSPWGPEVSQGPGQNMCLHQGPFWKCDPRRNDRGKKKRREGENCPDLECLPPVLECLPPGTLFTQTSLWPAPSQPSSLCSNVTTSERPSVTTPAMLAPAFLSLESFMSAYSLQNIIITHH